jgi:hypothetical protein
MTGRFNDGEQLGEFEDRSPSPASTNTILRRAERETDAVGSPTPGGSVAGPIPPTSGDLLRFVLSGAGAARQRLLRPSGRSLTARNRTSRCRCRQRNAGWSGQYLCSRGLYWRARLWIAAGNHEAEAGDPGPANDAQRRAIAAYRTRRIPANAEGGQLLPAPFRTSIAPRRDSRGRKKPHGSSDARAVARQRHENAQRPNFLNTVGGG